MPAVTPPLMQGGRALISTAVNATKAAVKSGPGTVEYVDVVNPHASAAGYLHIYDKASGGVTVGTTIPWRSIYVPPASSRTLGRQELGICEDVANGTSAAVAERSPGITVAATVERHGGTTNPTTAFTLHMVYQ